MGVAPAVAVFSSKLQPRSIHRHPGGNFEMGGERLGVGCYKGGGSWGRQTLAFNSLNHLKFSPRTSSKLEFVQRTSIDEVFFPILQPSQISKACSVMVHLLST
ncbi:hypothetical protein HPP92_025908 [Vanilla planifolia]|uniref:Uncharacterized protein n=1 Tax=Vanilla planifolia TaxID=51239 RepID=A0A835PH10_VANPL|nr:hypothetical protein HPP92_025908 [Vanilla planifolia]